ncbi:hypothetical protein [Wolbachia endosymbiont of Ctenocephalides felis wCfeJ]|uniref:hypothetical protein n=1 Tax=Wolbachia endosymbiont of Ctenocephalides felis wCfeJ TaxID=2732594 RepID=UPI001447A0A0|nr:hypothetical protein [Wolbachia endosymbiont of Ctenocephalides felis wCfeJ]WCR57744.1 MAG: hypothetical protein PG980_000216 [Wolbachia endosymbiont of Ctenocephalides felis wCfeJ]
MSATKPYFHFYTESKIMYIIKNGVLELNEWILKNRIRSANGVNLRKNVSDCVFPITAIR